MIYHDVTKGCMNENGMKLAKMMEDKIRPAMQIWDGLPFEELEASLQNVFFVATTSNTIGRGYHHAFCKENDLYIHFNEGVKREVYQIFTSLLNFEIVSYKMRRKFKGEGKGDGGI